MNIVNVVVLVITLANGGQYGIESWRESEVNWLECRALEKIIQRDNKLPVECRREVWPATAMKMD